KLLIPSYLWSAAVAVAGTLILCLFSLTRVDGYMFHVALLSFMLSVTTSNLMILMGKERIREYNLVTAFQMIILFIVLFALFFIFGLKDIMAYLFGLYFSYGSGLLLSLLLILPELKKDRASKSNKNVLKELFHYGTIMQAANIFQFLNYRISYYFIEFFMGKGALGVFSVGTQLSESIWILSKSMSAVQYTRIANQDDPAYAARVTLTFVKISFILTFIALAVILLLIHLFFPLIFHRPEFAPVKYIMLILSSGILVFSVSIVLSPYFSGIGKPNHNMISSGLGLVCASVFGFILIPRFGLAGAAMTAVISYSTATLYQFIVFLRLSKILFRDFMLTRSEIQMTYRFFLSLQHKKPLV
ncbi:MAG TPA: polysaccharide biosynthesis C-terminal domain-containing protein, partial [Bacteroidales bacterium]|nr:polysaccharide biosynthesis C-terminal domain-containing protein [Bacteroidales bacterium]